MRPGAQIAPMVPSPWGNVTAAAAFPDAGGITAILTLSATL